MDRVFGGGVLLEASRAESGPWEGYGTHDVTIGGVNMAKRVLFGKTTLLANGELEKTRVIEEAWAIDIRCGESVTISCWRL